jgi:hypothetical protein
MIRQISTWTPQFKVVKWAPVENPELVFIQLKAMKVDDRPGMGPTAIPNTNGLGPVGSAVKIHQAGNPANTIPLFEEPSVIGDGDEVINLTVTYDDFISLGTYTVDIVAGDPTWKDQDGDNCTGCKITRDPPGS